MAYGTEGEVAALTPRYANSAAVFDATTRPTFAQVTTLIAQVSSILNSLLSQAGFVIPVTDADVLPMLNFFVEQEVAAMVEGINGSGRFGPTTGDRAPGKSRFSMILKDVMEFIEANAIGMEKMGATRERVATSGIGYRDTNQQGDSTFPLFERDSFLPNGGFRDWDIDG